MFPFLARERFFLVCHESAVCAVLMAYFLRRGTRANWKLRHLNWKPFPMRAGFSKGRAPCTCFKILCWVEAWHLQVPGLSLCESLLKLNPDITFCNTQSCYASVQSYGEGFSSQKCQKVVEQIAFYSQLFTISAVAKLCLFWSTVCIRHSWFQAVLQSSFVTCFCFECWICSIPSPADCWQTRLVTSFAKLVAFCLVSFKRLLFYPGTWIMSTDLRTQPFCKDARHCRSINLRSYGTWGASCKILMFACLMNVHSCLAGIQTDW